jgi:hypothetical protein
MFTIEQRVDLLLNTLNEAVTMLFKACNINTTEEKVLILRNMPMIKNIRFIRKNCSNAKSNTTNKKMTRTTIKNVVRSKILD